MICERCGASVDNYCSVCPICGSRTFSLERDGNQQNDQPKTVSVFDERTVVSPENTQMIFDQQTQVLQFAQPQPVQPIQPQPVQAYQPAPMPNPVMTPAPAIAPAPAGKPKNNKKAIIATAIIVPTALLIALIVIVIALLSRNPYNKYIDFDTAHIEGLNTHGVLVVDKVFNYDQFASDYGIDIETAEENIVVYATKFEDISNNDVIEISIAVDKEALDAVTSKSVPNKELPTYTMVATGMFNCVDVDMFDGLIYSVTKMDNQLYIDYLPDNYSTAGIYMFTYTDEGGKDAIEITDGNGQLIDTVTYSVKQDGTNAVVSLEYNETAIYNAGIYFTETEKTYSYKTSKNINDYSKIQFVKSDIDYLYNKSNKSIPSNYGGAEYHGTLYLAKSRSGNGKNLLLYPYYVNDGRCFYISYSNIHVNSDGKITNMTHLSPNISGYSNSVDEVLNSYSSDYDIWEIQ